MPDAHLLRGSRAALPRQEQNGLSMQQHAKLIYMPASVAAQRLPGSRAATCPVSIRLVGAVPLV